MAEKSETTPTYCRTMFSPSEEEVISRFLISCWKKKLRVPHILLYDALKKHVDKYPRKSRAKDNRPSHFWRQRFFQRNPHVQEAYDEFKASPHKDYDVVSDHLLNAFISDLAHAEKPYAEEDIAIDSREISNSSSGKTKKKLIGKSSPQKAEKDPLESPQKERMRLLADKLIKHRRSKTSSAASLVAKASGTDKPGRRKSLGGLKLSTTLFSAKKNSKSTDDSNVIPKPEKVASIPSISGVVVQPKPKTNAQTTKRNEVPADAVPLEAIKFEEGASVEAMDGFKWYKAKIVEVYHHDQQVLVHFNGWRKRFDTIFPMNSELLRGPTQPDRKEGLKKFNVGDDVLSQWTDGKFYPGTVMSVKDSGSYVVMFYDGLKKLVRPNMLKPLTSEKEKDAALYEATKTYLLPFDSTTGSPLMGASGPGHLSRRYRTSANDRERRVTARQTSGEGTSTSPKQRRAARKRKRAQTLDPSLPLSPTTGYKFHAKQARLDKITDNLKDKAVPSLEKTTSTPASSFSQSEMLTSQSEKMSTLAKMTSSRPTAASVSASSTSAIQEEPFHHESYFSDESDNPLIIDEGESFVHTETKATSAVKKTPDLPVSTAPSALDSGSSKLVDENLHKLADAALTHSVPSTKKVVSKKNAETGLQRDEASQALLQLAQATTSSTAAQKVEETLEPVLLPADLKVLPFEKKIEVALKKFLKEDVTVIQAAEDLDLKVEEVHDAVALHPGVILGSIDPRFLVTSEEDLIVNWIHDVTDLGWGVKPLHIAKKIKTFLTAESYVVLFDDSNSINMPTAPWINDFLARHPEIFPGREKPMGRFRFDREGFEEWLGRWLAVLRSKDVKTNAVYYCDETVWDLNAKLPELTFLHETRTLDSTHKNGNRITAISCVGATGIALTPFYVFPDNEKSPKINKNLYSDNLVFSTRGALNSNIFLYWMKKIFIREIPTNKRPAALLVDAQLEILDYEIIKFAEENNIILYRFLPQGAHFIQHPDQKLFGRLRLQWKKAVFSHFLKENAGKTVPTQSLVNYYRQEYHRIASSSTIKMCFELTKLYEPLPEPIAETSPKGKKKRRKNTASKTHILPSEEATPTMEITKKEKPQARRTKKTNGLEAVKPATASSPTEIPVPVVEAQSPETSKPVLKTRLKVKVGVSRGRGRGRGRLRFGRGAGPGRGRGGLRGIRMGLGVQSKRQSGINKQLKGAPKVPAVAPHPQAVPVLKSKYKKGETVLAKWSDCKLYTATVLKKIGKDDYKIKYFDGLEKVVSTDFLRAWSSLPVVSSLSSDGKRSSQSPASKASIAAPSPATRTSTSAQFSVPKIPISGKSPATRTSSSGQSPATRLGTSGQSPATRLGTSGRSPATRLGTSGQSSATRLGTSGESPATRLGTSGRSPATRLGTSVQSPATRLGASGQSPATRLGASGQSPATRRGASEQIPATELGASGKTLATRLGSSGQSPATRLASSGQSPATRLAVSGHSSTTRLGTFGQSPATRTSRSSRTDEETARKSQNLRRGILPSSGKPKSRGIINVGDKIRTRNLSEKVGLARGRRFQKGSGLLPDMVYTSIKPEARIRFKIGDAVLCKWTDRRMYPATILKYVSEERYMVKYFDNRKKVVHFSWVWPIDMAKKMKPPITSVQKSKVSAKPAPPADQKTAFVSGSASPVPETASAWEETTTPAESSTSLSTSAATPISPPTAAPISVAISQAEKAKEKVSSKPDSKPVFTTPALPTAKPISKPTSSLRTRRSLSKQDSTDSDTAVKVPAVQSGDSNASSISSSESEPKEDDFAKGDTVLARWTDCKSYPATVLKRTEDGQYEVRYYDGMVRILKKDMLKTWDINSVPLYKPRKLKKQPKTESDASTSVAGQSSSQVQQVSETKEKVKPPKVKPTIAGDVSGTVTSDVKAPPVVKPVSLTYEAYYTKLTQESELHKFKCRAPGCNKVFRRESVLKQHHKHYHLQRYKLRDQEMAPSIKRKASKEELPPSKRRVSADFNSTFQKPQSPSSPAPTTQPVVERPTRSKGGKPPLDVIQQNTEKSITSREPIALKKVPSPERPKSGESTDKPPTPTKKRRKRSDPPQVQAQAAAANTSTPDQSEERESRSVVNEDVIRCVCEREEDEGFMLQCDSCLTWQHARCEGIASPEQNVKEDSLPEYVCTICKDPPGVRESHRYQYNNNFLTKGVLPRALPQDSLTKKELEEEKHFEKLMLATNRLMEELVKMQESLHGIRMKIKIADPEYVHPLLHLWKDAGPTAAMQTIYKSVDLTTSQIETKAAQIPTTTVVKMEVQSSPCEEKIQNSEIPATTTNTTDNATNDSDDIRCVLDSMIKDVQKAIMSTSSPSAESLHQSSKLNEEVGNMSPVTESLSDLISELVDKTVANVSDPLKDDSILSISGIFDKPNANFGENLLKSLEQSNQPVKNDSEDHLESTSELSDSEVTKTEKNHSTSDQYSSGSGTKEAEALTMDQTLLTHSTEEDASSQSLPEDNEVSPSSTYSKPVDDFSMTEDKTADSSTAKGVIADTLPDESIQKSTFWLDNVEQKSSASNFETNDKEQLEEKDIDKIPQGLPGAAAMVAGEDLHSVEGQAASLSVPDSIVSSLHDTPSVQDSGYQESPADLQASSSSGFYDGTPPVAGGLEQESSTPPLMPESQPLESTSSNIIDVPPNEQLSVSSASQSISDHKVQDTGAKLFAKSESKQDEPMEVVSPEKSAESLSRQDPPLLSTEFAHESASSVIADQTGPETFSRTSAITPESQSADGLSNSIAAVLDEQSDVQSVSESTSEETHNASPKSSVEQETKQEKPMDSEQEDPIFKSEEHMDVNQEPIDSKQEEPIDSKQEEPMEVSSPENLAEREHKEDVSALSTEVADESTIASEMSDTPPLMPEKQTEGNSPKKSETTAECEEATITPMVSESITPNMTESAQSEDRSNIDQTTASDKTSTTHQQSKSLSDDDLWTTIKIIKEPRLLDSATTRRNRSKSEDSQEEQVIRSRGNLLQHIHQLELALSERLTRVENYVTTVEAAFKKLVRSSPTSSQVPSCSYDSRLGELQSDLNSLHKDIESVEKLFLS